MNKIILFTLIFFVIGVLNVSAESESTNLSLPEIKTLISETAREHGIPPEILKAIAVEESKYKQFNDDGTPNISSDGGIGIMQITPDKIDIPVDMDRLKMDIEYNIEIGALVLLEKWNLGYLPKINNHDKAVLEDWYFAIMAYNGLSKSNDPKENPGNTYQEKIYKRIANSSFITGEFVFPEFDLRYEDNNEVMFFPPGINYVTSKTTLSQQMYSKGDIVYVDGRDGSVNLRNGSDVISKLWPYTPLTITAEPVETDNFNNDFVYYEVKGVKANGTLASAYLLKGSEDLLFTDPMDDQRAAALAFAVMNGYVKGYPDGSFGSGNPLKREHVAVILDNILELTKPADYKVKADDITDSHPYYEQLAEAEYNGLLGGGGKLRPSEHFTRAQMAQVMTGAFADYYDKPTEMHIFKDHAKIWNPDAVNTIYFNNVTVADPFNPGNAITRSQFAIFIYRTLVDF
ncbi:S-layer homology domain-containing protein [Ornithinibacillus californiensis]|uniref:S-layer homology domain-containing protein n=1 Tax=Ornithinibacillus californiensis TaxID=161536 RepID=UPI001F1D87FF|nr:S-layer homology domain-containing protein [Ornithinibacillus californiensis]